MTVPVLVAALGACASPARAASSTARNAVGIGVGIPHTVALEYERTVSSRWFFRGHAGSVILLSSVGARICRGTVGQGFHPYAFAGGALIHAEPDKPGDAEGAAVYLWAGPGLAWRTRRYRVYGEVSALLGGSRDRGLGDASWVFPLNPAVSGGIAVRL